nr:hypothetical protein [Tanacetum cinerariifolium]
MPQLNDKGFVDSRYSRHMTGNIAYLSDFKEFDRETKDETSKILKNFMKEIENLVDKKVKIIRCDHETEFKNKVMDDFCREKVIKKEYSVARTPQQNGVAERRNRTLIEAARTMLAGSKLPTKFWAEVIFTACYVQSRVLIVNPHNKIPYELLRGFKQDLSFMKPFGCHVTILNTLDNLGQFDGKSDEGTLSNETGGIQGDLNACTSILKEQVSQDSIVMLIWKDASYFDSPTKDVANDEPNSPTDYPKQVKDGPSNECDDKDESADDSSSKEDNTARQQVNTASPAVNIVVSPINTASPKDMVGASHLFEDTHIEFFGGEDELEVDLGNIPNSYTVPTTPHTRIHKNHPLKNVIGDVQSSIQTRRMEKLTSEQGFLSAIYEGKTHEDLHTCLFACFLSQEEPKRISKALRHRAIGTKWVFRNKKDERGIVIRNKDKYVDDVLRKFNHNDVNTGSTPVHLEKPLVKDRDVNDVDVHLYRSMIGSLMYLTTSRLDIAIVACARFQVAPKTSHLLAVKRIFRYLKGKPTLGLWYSRNSPFELVAYTDSDYAGANQDRKSTTDLLTKGFDAGRFQYMVSSNEMLNP